MESRRVLLGVVLLVVGLAAGLLVARLASNGSRGYATQPTGATQAHEVATFDSPPDMADAADVVVVAEVLGAHPGRTRGELEAEQLVDRIVDLRIVEVMDAARNQRKLRADSVVQMVEGYWETNGEGFVVNDLGWSTAGATGIYFLHQMDGETVYRPVSSYGRLLYDDQTVPNGPSGEEPDEAGPWADTPPADLDDLATAEAVVEQVVREAAS